MTVFALLFIFSAIGVSETVYLVRKRRAVEHPVCPLGGNCSAVLTSEYRMIFGIPNDVWGMLFYSASLVFTVFLALQIEPVALWQTAFSVLLGVALAVSVFLTYIQWKVIQAWCFWCLVSAALVTGMALTISINLFATIV